jgi:hypothetical protein
MSGWRGPYVDRRWDDHTRRQYLLRPDVEWPLSMDTWVWPSVFFWNSFRPTWDGLAPGAVFIAIGLLSEKSAEGPSILYEEPGGIQCGKWLDPHRTRPGSRGSHLLGFDVATGGGISGLCNCGYTAEEVAQFAPVWAPRLNVLGLLATLDDAIEFRQLTDVRASDDGPFWVYALWRLPID